MTLIPIFGNEFFQSKTLVNRPRGSGPSRLVRSCPGSTTNDAIPPAEFLG